MNYVRIGICRHRTSALKEERKFRTAAHVLETVVLVCWVVSVQHLYHRVLCD